MCRRIHTFTQLKTLDTYILKYDRKLPLTPLAFLSSLPLHVCASMCVVDSHYGIDRHQPCDDR